MDSQIKFNLASLIITLITVAGAYFSQKAASKAGRKTADGEAYERARKIDVETIDRQDEELSDLREELKEVRVKSEAQAVEIRQLRSENADLRTRLSRLEREVPAITEQVND